jgi:hypothetical protein
MLGAATGEPMTLPDHVDTDKLAEIALALALLSPTSFTDHGLERAWKGLDWDVLDLIYQRGWILDPKGTAKSVVFTETGKDFADAAFMKHFSQSSST